VGSTTRMFLWALRRGSFVVGFGCVAAIKNAELALLLPLCLVRGCLGGWSAGYHVSGKLVTCCFCQGVNVFVGTSKQVEILSKLLNFCLTTTVLLRRWQICLLSGLFLEVSTIRDLLKVNGMWLMKQ
jgi:hypothetical protein